MPINDRRRGDQSCFFIGRVRNATSFDEIEILLWLSVRNHSVKKKKNALRSTKWIPKKLTIFVLYIM